MTTSLPNMYEQAFAAIEQARSFEKSNTNQAQLSYVKGITIFMKILKLESNENKKSIVKKHLHTFMSKAEKLKNANPSAPPPETAEELSMIDLPDPPSSILDLPDPPSIINRNRRKRNSSTTNVPIINIISTMDETPLEKAQSLLNEAIECDQSTHLQQALDYYKESSQLYLDCLKSSQQAFMSANEKNSIREKVKIILNRIETIDRLIIQQQKQSANRINKVGYHNNNNNNNNGGGKGVANEGLTNREIEILRRSSYIRNIVLYPWMDSDANSKFTFDEKWRDANGLLSLSAKQKSKFGKWKRISNICKKPKIVNIVTPYSITQTLITDCSFVSSITVTALYEKIFGRKLITSIIYPQDSSHSPVYNPSGKYIVKLFLNGCFRKVEVDDYLPVANESYGEKLLCSYSNDKNEVLLSLLFVSLVINLVN